MSEFPRTDQVDLGPDAQVDPDVVLGYLTGRPLADPTLRIGAGARIRSGSVVYAGTMIGDHLETGHGVVLREECIIGDHFKIWNHSCVDYGCRIGRNVRIHNNVYIAQFTEIGDDCFFAPGVMVANDKYPVRREGLEGPRLGCRVVVGIGAILMPGVRIGDGAAIGAGSVVTRDVPAGKVVYGNPARVRGDTADLPHPSGNLPVS